MKTIVLTILMSVLAAGQAPAPVSLPKPGPAIGKDEKASLASLIIKAQNDALMAEQAQGRAKDAAAEANSSFNAYNALLSKIKKELKAEGCEFDLVTQVFHDCKTEVASVPAKSADKK